MDTTKCISTNCSWLQRNEEDIAYCGRTDSWRYVEFMDVCPLEEKQHAYVEGYIGDMKDFPQKHFCATCNNSLYHDDVKYVYCIKHKKLVPSFTVCTLYVREED